MFLYLLLLFTLLPFVELALLLWLGEHLGWLHTLAMVIVTGVVGAALARWQGLRTLGRVREEMAAGQVPADALVDGLLILLAGLMLVTPGILTDACGFALLIPPLRRGLKRSVRLWFERHVRVETRAFGPGSQRNQSNGSPPRERVIDVQATGTRVVDEDG